MGISGNYVGIISIHQGGNILLLIYNYMELLPALEETSTRFYYDDTIDLLLIRN